MDELNQSNVTEIENVTENVTENENENENENVAKNENEVEIELDTAAPKENLEIVYFQVADIWKRFCDKHNELFNLTCEEYGFLLESNLDLLEETVEKKNVIIDKIGQLETLRSEIIIKINKLNPERNVENIRDLLALMQSLPIEKEQRHLFRFNALLIDIIEKIQEQNKKNQLFINKALISLKEIREGASGKKSYSTYSPKGSTKSTKELFWPTF